MSHQYIYLKQSIESEGLEINDVGKILHRSTASTTTVEFLRTQSTHTIDNSLYETFLIEETGDTSEKKVCDRCYKLLDTQEHFSNNRIKSEGFITKRPSCKACRKIKDGKPIPLKIRRIWDAKKPEHGAIFTCPICTKDSIVGITKIVLDHNHSNGEVRGWLCESCNTGIGRFDDDPVVIQKAIDWLKE